MGRLLVRRAASARRCGPGGVSRRRPAPGVSQRQGV